MSLKQSRPQVPDPSADEIRRKVAVFSAYKAAGRRRARLWTALVVAGLILMGSWLAQHR